MREDDKKFLKFLAWLYLGIIPIVVAMYTIAKGNIIEAVVLIALGYWFFVKEVLPRHPFN